MKPERLPWCRPIQVLMNRISFALAQEIQRKAEEYRRRRTGKRGALRDNSGQSDSFLKRGPYVRSLGSALKGRQN